MTTTLYGIKNCDTMKKAMTWLTNHGIDYQFHDYKKSGLTEQQLKGWVQQIGWEILVNTRGTTWRKLPESERENLDEAKAITLMLANLSLIKRPVLEHNNTLYVGFNFDEYEQTFR
jgi:arsenate reductase